jgi:N-acetylglucosamine-6-sulfatase
MCQAWIRSGLLCMIVVGWGVVAAARAQPGQPPCAQIRAACHGAGFVPGAATGGNGLWVDCINPIMEGRAQRSTATKLLPQVDPHIVAACQASNPRFGQPKATPSEAGEQPSPTRPLPPAAPVPSTPSPAPSTGTKRPNIVFILTDDLAWNLVQYMPHVLKMQQEGVTFANYFVTNSLCCPSRASIFTGRYPHNTGVLANTGKDGGYQAFRNRDHERTTFAIALSEAGYRTAMLGKYLNGYRPIDPVAPGWTSWAVAGGAGYREFHYILSEDGKAVRYGDQPTDYLTDVLGGLGVRFIKQSAGRPFFIEIATFAPHAPYTPAPRDADALPGLRAPRTPAFDAPPEANAPTWLRAMPALSDADGASIDKDFRKRAQAVRAVDAMIGALQAAVAAVGEEKNTYFVFSSDNGYHMGEHRLMPGKMTAYDTDIHVPLIVTGPGVPVGRTIAEITANIDLYATFTELGGAGAPTSIDGHSLVSLLHGQQGAAWRTVVLVEHRGPHKEANDPDAPRRRSGNPPTYHAMRTRTSLYVEYADGVKEYHDLASDPHELRNTFSALPSKEQASLHATIEALKTCHDAQSCWTAERPGRAQLGAATDRR